MDRGDYRLPSRKPGRMGISSPCFSDALTRAKLSEQRWWEDAGQEHMLTQGFSAGAWGKNMSCRFPKEWTDKQKIEHGAAPSFTALLSEINGATASLIP